MMLRRLLLSMSLLLGVGLFTPVTQPAQACPMCKIANEQDSLLPKAYMYSILFMMGMIFSLAGGVAFCVYSLSRKENAALEALGQYGGFTADANSLNLLPDGVSPATA